MVKRHLPKCWFVLLVMAALAVRADPANAQWPDRMVLKGTFLLDRSSPDYCVMAVPPTISGDIEMVVDFQNEEVTGEIRGQGTGEQVLAGCEGLDKPPLIFRAETTFKGKIVGTVNPENGEIVAEATLDIQGSGYGSQQGQQYLVDGRWQSELPLPEIVTPQRARISGRVITQGQVQGQIDWYTNFCARIEPGVTGWGRQGCPTIGTWTTSITSATWPDNSAPYIDNIFYSPERPESTDTVVITVQAGDPDGDALSYSWLVDGVQASAATSQVSWSNPPPGEHTVTAVVSDGKGGSVQESVSFYVSEGVADRDDDGVSDDEDACPDEFGLNPDGCPDFTVQLGCDPQKPFPRQPVVCSASLTGVREGESVEFHWYLDSAFVQTTSLPSWTWGKAESGTHDVDVQVVGEGRSLEARVILEVEEELDLVARIGMTPDPPLIGKSVMFAAVVEGRRFEETLSYQWWLDGEQLCTTPNCAWVAITGTHTVQLYVRGEEGRDAGETRSFEAKAGGLTVSDDPLAGFSVSVECSDGISSDDSLACTAGLRRERIEIGVLNVLWLIDGATAAMESTLGSMSQWSLDNPAPGSHSVQVQVTDAQTGRARIATTVAAVRPGRNAMIPPSTQAATAGMTLTSLGAWLWLEWWRGRAAEVEERARQRADDLLETDRKQWFKEKEEINRQKLERRRQWEAHQDRLKQLWKDQFEKLRAEADKDPRRERLLDSMDQHYKDVYRNGVWDAKQMQRLGDMLGRMGAIQDDVAKTQRVVKQYNRARSVMLEALTDTFCGGFWSKFTALRIASDVVTFGAAEAIWMPVTATVRTLNVRADILLNPDKYKDPRWAIFKEGFKGLAADYLITKVFTTAPKALAPEIGHAIGRADVFTMKYTPTFRGWAVGLGRWAAEGAERLVEATPVGVKDAAARFWNAVNTPLFGRAATPKPLPVIQHVRGEPVTYMSPPVYHPDFVPVVPVGWINQMRHLEAINPALARGVGRLASKAADGALQLQSNTLLRAGQQMGLTADEQVGAYMANNPYYRQALDQGLIPRSVRGVVNHARYKVAKYAAFRALESLPPEVRARIHSIDATGTGARPFSSAALNGPTDLDLTVNGHPAAGELGRRAERLFAQAFDRELMAQGMNAKVADIHMFPGVHARVYGRPSGGYGSPELTNWLRTDASFRGQRMIPTDRGSMILDANPSAHPIPGQGPFDPPVPRAALSPGSAIPDARRVILEKVAAMPEQLGRTPSRLDILRLEGKHAMRAWQSANRGTGAPVPSWIRTLEQMKADRTWYPPGNELNQAWNQFVKYFNLGDRLGGVQ